MVEYFISLHTYLYFLFKHNVIRVHSVSFEFDRILVQKSHLICNIQNEGSFKITSDLQVFTHVRL